MDIEQPLRYSYRLRTTGESSAKFGPCEVCGKHCSEVFIQREFRLYLDDETGKLSTTYDQCRGALFGCEPCLKSQQRKGGGA